MIFTEPFLAPSLCVSTITATPGCWFYNISMPLMIPIFKALHAYNTWFIHSTVITLNNAVGPLNNFGTDFFCYLFASRNFNTANGFFDIKIFRIWLENRKERSLIEFTYINFFVSGLLIWKVFLILLKILSVTVVPLFIRWGWAQFIFLINGLLRLPIFLVFLLHTMILILTWMLAGSILSIKRWSLLLRITLSFLLSSVVNLSFLHYNNDQIFIFAKNIIC